MITLTNVEMDLGKRLLFSNVSFLIQRGDRIGLVGRNGAGKSTLLGILSGDRRATGGSISRQNGITIGLLSQDLTLDLNRSLRETAEAAFEQVLILQDKIEELQRELSTRTDYDSEDYMGVVQNLTDSNELFASRGGLTMHADIERILVGLGFEQKDMDKPLTMFSGGWQMRAELGRLLLMRPDCLLLDEPTNHLDIDSVQWLENFLREYEGGIILVSHDRTFLDNVTNRTIEITKTRVYDIPASYSAYEEIRAERMEQQRAAYIQQTRERERVEKWVDRFRYKASLATRVQSRIKHLQKLEVVEVDDNDTSSMQFHFPPAPRSGRTLVEVKDLYKAYGEKKVLNAVNFHIERGEKIAFIGKNGEGKTTLAKIIAGEEQPTKGEILLGYNTLIGFYAQHQADMLGGQNTIYEVMEQGAPPEMRSRVRTLLGAFLFSGDDVHKKVGVLSGGEKSRLALARLLLQPANLLILDEPTNHLDMLSKEVLKEALLAYDGAMIVVSHDRDFLDGLTEKTIGFRGGLLKEYEGDIDDYIKSLAANSAESKAIKEKQEAAQRSAVATAPVVQVKSADELRNERKAAEKERKRLEKRVQDVERQIAIAEKSMAELEPQLADPELYKDKVAQHKVISRYEMAKGNLERLMAEWEDSNRQMEQLT